MAVLTEEDSQTLAIMVDAVLINKHQGIACKVEKPLSQCYAQVYHMGKDNPVLRIDLKLKEDHR